jgi:hypothetical protein
VLIVSHLQLSRRLLCRFPLANFFLNRATEPSTQRQLFATRRAKRFGFAAQIVFAFWLQGMNGYGSWVNWFEYGGGQPKSPLYDIWEVDQQSTTFWRGPEKGFQRIACSAIIDSPSKQLRMSHDTVHARRPARPHGAQVHWRVPSEILSTMDRGDSAPGASSRVVRGLEESALV